MQYTRLPQSEGYADAREKLRLAEIDLIAHREQVAVMRRELPEGPMVPDYTFLEGPTDLDAGDTPAREVRLSELFSAPDRPLVVYHLMYGKAQETPCPMCTMWIDGFNGVARHLTQNADLAVAAAADLPTLRAFARQRGWANLRLLSCGDSTFKYDLCSEEADGSQDSTITVFVKEGDTMRLTYTGKPRRGDDLPERGIDALCATWNILDLTPQGRGDWYSGLDY